MINDRNDFTYSYLTKVYFCEDAAKKTIAAEMGRFGNTVMLVYGGGSIKKSGVYEEMKTLLYDAGKEIVEFSGIMPNPTYAKVAELCLWIILVRSFFRKTHLLHALIYIERNDEL